MNTQATVWEKVLQNIYLTEKFYTPKYEEILLVYVYILKSNKKELSYILGER